MAPEQATLPPQQPTTAAAASTATSVPSIVASVSGLLRDYAFQLRDDVGTFTTTTGGMKSEEDKPSTSIGDDGTTLSATGDVTAAAVGEEEEEDTAQLTEADVVECRGRLQRLRRIQRLLLHAMEDSALGNSAGSRRDTQAVSSSPATLQSTRAEREEMVQDHSRTMRRNPVLMTLLSRLELMKQQFEGCTAAAAASTSPSAPTASPHAPKSVEVISADAAVADPPRACRTIVPLLTPVSLAEGALAAFSRNIGVVFRRRSAPSSSASGRQAILKMAPQSTQHHPNSKRAREAGNDKDDTAVKASDNHWARLAAQQRKSHFALYTMRAALLPRVDRVCAPFYVSLAVQQLAQLNAAAERGMLERAWRVHTKAHLLREVPSVARDVEESRQALREALKSFSPTQQDRYLRDVSYVRFCCTDDGILRLCVQHALFLDLTYDVKRGQWLLLELHWNLYTTAAGSSLISTALTESATVAAAEEMREVTLSSEFCASSETHRQLLPENREALFAFLQGSLVQGGLSGGLQTANRLVCAVVLDALATQLYGLQQMFFTGGALGRLVDVEVRPGTFISLHLSLSDVLGAPAPAALAAGADVVHVKLTTCGGTVTMERVRGTNLATRSVVLLLGASSLVQSQDANASGPPRVVVDMEALLWQCLSADS